MNRLLIVDLRKAGVYRTWNPIGTVKKSTDTMVVTISSQGRSALLWIVAFKVLKATALLALSITLLATRHTDPVDLLIRFALVLHLPLTAELFQRAVSFATQLTIGRQTALAMTAFGYAILMGIEGIGLYFRKPWARWLTIIATSSLIPIEVYELAREPRPLRLVVLVANAVIVAFLYRRRAMFDSAA